MKIDTNMDMDYNHYKSNPLGHLDSLTRILKPIIGEIEIPEEYLTKVGFSHLSNSPQAIILYNIIQDWLLFNYLQKIVIEKVLNHTISNERNQCHLRNDQLLVYIRRERGVEKNKIVKAIYLGFGFLKRQKKLLIVASIRVTIANISSATIHETLSIDNHIQKQ